MWTPSRSSNPSQQIAWNPPSIPKNPRTTLPTSTSGCVTRALSTFHTTPKACEGEPKNWPLQWLPHHYAFWWRVQKHSVNEAKGACLEQLHTLNMKLGLEYANPLDISLNIITKSCAGIFKLHLKYLIKDNIALLKGEQVFMMEMGRGKKVIGKVEKGFKHQTPTHMICIHNNLHKGPKNTYIT